MNEQLIEAYFENKFSHADSSIFRDLSLNLKKILLESPLEPIERMLNLAAIATTLRDLALQSLAFDHLKKMSLTAEQIREAFEAAGIMGLLNTYYKFKGYLSTESVENYSRAGLRMQSLSKPHNGKERFEMMALAVSVVNGCPTCIMSHEKVLVQSGVSIDKIHDIARLAAICKGLNGLEQAQQFLMKSLSVESPSN